MRSSFFSRSDPARSSVKSLIATISYQIAINILETREKFIAATDHDLLVLTRFLEAQFAALIVDLLRELLVAIISIFRPPDVLSSSTALTNVTLLLSNAKSSISFPSYSDSTTFLS